MKKGKKLNAYELETVSDGKTNLIVVSQSGHERICTIDKNILEYTIYDVENRFCEVYLCE